MNITLTADVFTLKAEILKKVTDAFIRQEMTKAVKIFLRTCLPKIPRRTGFLRGSFSDIARFFKVTGTGAGEGGYATKPEFYYHSAGNRIPKKPLYGTRFATPPEQVLRQIGSNVVFELDNAIKYFTANDVGSGVPGSPWNSVKEGLSAMTSYLEGSPQRFPKIEALFTKMTIRAVGRSVTKTEQNPDVDGIIATRELLIEGFD
jgi:hypothetical protein